MERVILLTEDNTDNEDLTQTAWVYSNIANIGKVARDGIKTLDWMLLNQASSFGTEKGGG